MTNDATGRLTFKGRNQYSGLSAVERFESMIAKDSATQCWLWKVPIRGKNPYPNFWNGERCVRALRWSYQHFVGPIPTGTELDHTCRNKICVNPAHLEPVSHRINVLRGNAPMAKQAQQTHCINGHPFDDKNTRIRRCGRRECRICADKRRNLWRSKQKQK